MLLAVVCFSVRWNKFGRTSENRTNKLEKNNYQAILKYCTGSGKTMIAMKAIKEMLERGKIPLVIVDGTHSETSGRRS